MSKRIYKRQSNVKNRARTERVRRNQLTDLIIHGKIVTTHTKAKELSRHADKLITIAKKDTVAARRHAAKILRNIRIDENETALTKLFTKLGPKYADRSGGYTRVLRFGTRRGDGVTQAIIV
ncbi:MAG: 50S ribosomal protein L17 [Tenericutes bacterium]|nr:MAG: 50S ribosomal protein L17 [Mycoplasmatota bacterium]